MQKAMMETLASADPNTEQDSLALSDGPLFVVGMFRSGTSLLYALLNQHPQIALLYEDDLAHLPSLFWFPTKTSRWLAKWDNWNGGPSRHNIDGSELPKEISDIRTAAREVYVQYARKKKGATIWGTKSPTFYDSLARLGRAFPNARYVIIWRDVHDVCGSIQKASTEAAYFRSNGMLLRALLGYHDMKVQCDTLIKRGLPVHEIYYEDLASDSTATMRGICEFLNIPFDPKMTTLKGADRSVIENGSHHSMVKAESIAKPRKSRDVLPAELNAKIDRYLNMWRKKYNGAWPRYPRSVDSKAGDPSLWERWRDALTYRSLRAWLHTIPVIFCLVPSSAWEVYRRLRKREFEWQEAKLEKAKKGEDRLPR